MSGAEATASWPIGAQVAISATTGEAIGFATR
jgi:hypothetical protein